MSKQENKFTNIKGSNIITGSVGGHVINAVKPQVPSTNEEHSEDAPSADEVQEEISYCLTLINECKKRLRILEIQATQLGLYTPPHIQVEIDDYREKIRKLELRIKELSKYI